MYSTVLFSAIRCCLHTWFLVAGERRNRARKLDGEVRLYPVLYWLCSWSRKRLEISLPVLQKWRRSGHTASELAYLNWFELLYGYLKIFSFTYRRFSGSLRNHVVYCWDTFVLLRAVLWAVCFRGPRHSVESQPILHG